MIQAASLYRSTQGYRAMMSTYDAQLQRWPVPFDELMVETGYGRTHIVASGPVDAPPLLLIHGLAANALVWRPNVAALSAHFRVYALDNVGDAGKSAPSRPALHNNAYGRWIVDVLDGLDIARANLMGMSFGGWITLKAAIHAPERVDKIISLCPAGFVPIRLGFVLTAVRAGVLQSDQAIESLARSLCAPTTTMSAEDHELFNLSVRHHRAKLVPLLPLSAEELARVKAPALVLIGRHDAIFDGRATVERARRLIDGVQADIIPDVGHAINADRPEALHRRVLDFLGAHPR